jgi:hypothetical protein
MQTVSQTAKAILELGSRLGVSISCSNGLTITENDMIQGSFSIDRNSVSGDVIEIGNAETTELLFTLDNHDGRFDSYSFAGETLTVDIMIGTEPLRAGVFTIDNSPQKLHSMKISALDNMAKFNKKYVPGTASTLGQLLVYCCNQCGVTLNTTTFTNSAQACNQPTSETTYHQVVAWIAELAGKNAYIGHNGELYLGWYGSTKQPITSNHRFDFEVDEEDITITGVGHDDGENTTVVGTSDYALIIKGNDLVGDNISTILNNIYNVIGGYTYRPYSFSIMPMPYLWPMDEIEITMPDDSIVNSIITSHNFTLNGRSLISAVGKAEEQYGYASAPALTASQKVIIERLADSKVEMSATQMEQAMLALNQLIANSLGYFTTTVESGGAKTTYIHDKSTLASSDIIYVLTGSGFAWTDTGWNGGNPTWQYGLSGTGNAVLKVLSAYGINAEWINTGTLNAARVSIGSGTTFASGYDPSTKETPAGAQAKVDAIQIGARNLAWSTKEDWGDWITPPANASSGRYIVGFAYLPEDKAVGDEYTCAVEIEFKDVGAGSGGAFRFYADGRVDYQDNVTNIWNTNLISLTTPPADGIQRRVYTAQITADNVNGEQFDLGFCSYYWNGTGKYRVRRIKVEKGNRDTDWSPAPEDVDANITGSAAATKNNVATNLGYTDYADMVAKATQGKTIIDGGYINTDLIEANSITASKIAAGTITATEIASDSITSDKLNVLAKSLVNNYSRTGVLTGWETTDGSIVVDTDLNAPVHRVTTTTNRTIRSDYFEVDPTKTYKVTLSIKCEDTDGARHFGLWAYDKDSTNIAVTPFGGDSQTFGTPTTSFYFKSHAGSTNGWLHMEAYILGCNVTDKSEIPIGKNANYHCRMPANCSKIRLRYLNYGTAGTTRTAYFFSPTVTPVDSGTIRAESIVAGTIDAGLVNIVTGTGTSKVEITGTGIDGYLNDILRVQLEYDRLEFHRAGNVVGNVRSEYVNQTWHGSTIGDALFIEAAGKAIVFNAVSGSTAPSLVVGPTWAEAPTFDSEVITVGVTDPKKWTIKTNSTDTEFSIEHYLGTKLALSSGGAIKVNDVSLATEPIHFYHYTKGVLIDLGVAPTSNNLYTLKIFGNSYNGVMPVDTILQFHWRASSSLIESCKQINNALGIDAAKVFTDGGNIKVWFPQPATYTRFYIDCYDSSGKLQPVSVTNASEPTGTGKVTATSFSSWTSQNFNPDNYLPLSGGTMTGQLNMGSNNIVGSTSNCWITARRIGLGVAANSTYTMDAGTTGNIRCNQVYATKYHAGAGEGQSAMVKVLDSLPSSGPVHRVLEFVNGILVGFHTV